MQSSKKKLLKIIGLILLIIVVGAGWWAADFFLIPKAQQKGVAAPVDLHPTQEVVAEDKYPLLLDEFPADAVDLPVEA